MDAPPVIVLIVAVAVALVLGAGIAGLATGHVLRRERGSWQAETDELLRHAVEHAALVGREQLGAGLAGHQREVDQVRTDVRSELAHLTRIVAELGQHSAEQLGRVEQNLRAQREITGSLANSTHALREALASPKHRGQWGERLAEDVLRAAGFVEHVNYDKQTAIEGSRSLPDFTFHLPRGHVLFMDVKFPLPAYLRCLEATSDAERATERTVFLRDVRARVTELAARDYPGQSTAPAVGFVLLFLPNEAISGFIHEHDPDLIDFALGRNVVVCSPLTLFAFLGVIRQAFDNFVIERTTDEVLALLGTFDTQWRKFSASLDAAERKLESFQREFEQLSGTRRRQLERPLGQLEALRRSRHASLEP